MNNYYFAYGSNLNLEDLADWCLRRPGNGYSPDLLKPVCRAYLPDRRLAFSRYSTRRGGGVLDIWPESGRRVSGMVFKVDDLGRAMLDEKEGCSGYCLKNYRRIRLIAVTEDGRSMPVMTYEVVPHERVPFEEPTVEYIEIVRQGYRKFGLDELPLFDAACERPDITAVFPTDPFPRVMPGHLAAAKGRADVSRRCHATHETIEIVGDGPGEWARSQR